MSELTPEAERIQAALELIYEFEGIDGAHHKQWVLDGIVRTLCENETEYLAWVDSWENPGNEYDGDTWDIGIAP